MFWVLLIVFIAWIVLGSLKAVAGALFWIALIIILVAVIVSGVRAIKGGVNRP